MYYLNLEAINFYRFSRNCNQVTDTGISAVAERCPLIAHLNLEYVSILSASLVCITRNLEAIYFYRFSRSCNQVTDTGISAVAEHCPLIAHLDLTYVSIRFVPRICPLNRLILFEQSLSLYLRGCNQVTDTGISAIAEHCPLLAHLVLRCVSIFFSLPALVPWP